MSGPLSPLLAPLTVPASWIYRAGVAWRNRRFDRGAARAERLPLPVISIGNITAGGVGKTPMVVWLARRLHERGVRPLIALRGYGAASPADSDEAREYAELVPFAGRAVGADRVRSVVAALAQAGRRDGGAERPPDEPPSSLACDCILLDDGFQHRRVARDLDLVLVDARRCGLRDGLLPAGWLREPSSALRRATAVVVMHTECTDAARRQELAAQIRAAHGRAPIAWFEHRWQGLERIEPGTDPGATPEAQPGAARGTGGTRREPLEWFAGRRVVTLLGIGNPTGIAERLALAGAEVVGNLPVGDHQQYSLGDGERACRTAADCGADTIVTTRKDWTKLARFASEFTLPVAIPELEVTPSEGGEALLALVASVLRR